MIKYAYTHGRSTGPQEREYVEGTNEYSTGGMTMRISPLTILGEAFTDSFTLTKREEQTLRRAAQIADKARDALKARYGWQHADDLPLDMSLALIEIGVEEVLETATYGTGTNLSEVS